MNSIWTIAGVMALLTTGAVIPTDDGLAIEALMQQFEDAVDQAAQDVRFLPLSPNDGYGQTEGGHIETLSLIVRVSGPIDLDDLLVLHGGRPLDVDVEFLRGVDDGTADQGDLVRLDIDLALGPGHHVDLTVESPGARAAQWTVMAPKNLASDVVSIDVSARPL